MTVDDDKGLPNLRLSNFRLVSRLGVGGMGTVYLGEQINPRRPVAVKVIAPSDDLPRAFLDALKNEGDIAARFDHDNLITVHECGILDDHYYLAMQYLPGGDLEQRIRQGLNAADTAVVIRSIASALAHIHERGFIHRDVKPANILFSESGKPVLADFGIAKDASTVGALTSAGYASGTPAYMSPEQITNRAVDGRSDLYALGIVLYECLTGAPPFKADSPHQLKQAQVNEPPPPLPDAVSAFQPVIDRLLAKEPEDRFASGSELVAALDRLDLRNLTTTPSPALPAHPSAEDSDHAALTLWFREMAGRRVFRVLAIYVALAWGLTEIVTGIADRVPGVPDDLATFTTVAFLVGFPVVLLLAWLYDVDRAGITRVRTRHRGLLAVTVGLASVVSLTWLIVIALRSPTGGDVADTVAKTPVSGLESPVLVVLPLDVVGEDPALQILAQGIGEDLINAIGRTPGLRVMMYGSTLALVRRGLSPADIARQLGATHLVSGSLAWESDHQAITLRARLADAEQHQLWGDRFSDDVPNILGLLRNVADAIGTALGSAPVAGRSTGFKTIDPEAYAMLTRARLLLNQDDPTRHFDAMVDLARQATEIAPDYADAYAFLGTMLAVRAWMRGQSGSPNVEQARFNLELAVRLESDHAEAFAGLALVHMLRKEWAAAHDNVSRYFATDHQYVNAINVAAVLNAMGHFRRASDLLDAAIEADPLQPVNHMQYCIVGPNAHRFEDAVTRCETTLALGEGFYDGFADNLGFVLMRLNGDHERIRSLLVRGASRNLGDRELARQYADAVLDSELREDFLGRLRAAHAAGRVDSFWLGNYSYRLASAEGAAAAAWERIEDGGFHELFYFSFFNESVRSHPSFIPIMDTVGLPDYWRTVELPDFCTLDDGDLHCS